MKKRARIGLVLVCLTMSAMLMACAGKKGEKTLTLERDANPTTGYEWTCDISDSEVVTLVSQEYEADSKSEDKAGAGGKEVFVFEGAGEGTATITLHYHRSWEESEDDITEEIKVSVDGDGNISQVD